MGGLAGFGVRARGGGALLSLALFGWGCWVCGGPRITDPVGVWCRVFAAWWGSSLAGWPGGVFVFLAGWCLSGAWWLAFVAPGVLFGGGGLISEDCLAPRLLALASRVRWPT